MEIVLAGPGDPGQDARSRPRLGLSLRAAHVGHAIHFVSLLLHAPGPDATSRGGIDTDRHRAADPATPDPGGHLALGGHEHPPARELHALRNLLVHPPGGGAVLA